MKEDDALVAEQIAYYRARAPEYDDWFSRRGRYDRGPEHTARWDAEVELVREAVAAAELGGVALEIACGTGWWTAEIAKHVVSVTAVDAASEALRLNRERTPMRNVEYVEADIFSWRPDRKFDTVFFSFWLSHVPPERFSDFWSLVDTCLAPDGRVFFIDNRWYPEYRWDSRSDGSAPYVVRREINDGRLFRIVKVFYTPEKLSARLEPLGWRGTISETPEFFIWGNVGRAPPA